ncbi:hypothetical protein PHYBOEH_010668 [Phytophthora boehmeriae]|uniref:Uncharacterized protein n=1 Tax=Phytophthora boehmeriae TaxID=109152 RepID=A0A8T1VL56_9STRA|nr:hypothetical protein PHYBOEH_010668 [Phytophthora boehmeriae]
MMYFADYDVAVIGCKSSSYDSSNYSNSFRLLRLKNKAIIQDVTDGPTESSRVYKIYSMYTWPAMFLDWTGSLVIPSCDNGATISAVSISAPVNPGNGIVFGGVVVTESELGVIDTVSPGTATASKALIVDSAKSISDINALGRTTAVISGHNGSTAVLTLGSTLVTAIGTELNYLAGITPGTAGVTKAVVTDASSSISGITSLSAFYLKTNAGGSVIITNGSLIMGSTTLSETSFSTIAGAGGTAVASKALVVDANRSIGNINAVNASTVNGNVIGVVNTYPTNRFSSWSNITQSTTSDQCMGVTYSSTKGVYIASVQSPTSNRYYYSTDGLTWTAKTLPLSTQWGDCIWMPSPVSLFVMIGRYQTTCWSADGVHRCRYVPGVGTGIIVAIAYIGTSGSYTSDGKTWSTFSTSVSAGDYLTKPCMLNADRLCVWPSGSGTFTYSNSTSGSWQNLASSVTLSGLNSTGALRAMAYSPKLDRAVAVQSNTCAYKDAPTPANISAGWVYGTIPVSDQWLECQWIVELDAFIAISYSSPCKMIISTDGQNWTQMTITPTTSMAMAMAWNAAAKRLVVVGYGGGGIIGSAVADINPTSGSIVFGSTTLKETHVIPLYGATAGAAVPGKALLVDADCSVNNINVLKATKLTGQIQSPSQPLITSVGTLDSLAVARGVTVGATVISETDIKKIGAVKDGHAAPHKALVVDDNYNITDINQVTALKLAGEIQTPSQPHITSLGTLDSLIVQGDLECNGNLVVGGTIISESEIMHLDNAKPGAAEAFKAMITDSSNNIRGVNEFAATKLTGQVQTAAQPLISSVTTLDVTGHNASSAGLKLGGSLLTASASQLNQLVNGGFSPSFSTAAVAGTLTLSGANGSDTGLVLGNTLVTASAADLNRLDDTTPGAVLTGKAVVVDDSGDIHGFRHLTAKTLTAGALSTGSNDVNNVLSLATVYNGQATAGLGVSMEFMIQNSASMLVTGGRIVSSMTTLDSDAETTAMAFSTVQRGATLTQLTLADTGGIRVNANSNSTIDVHYFKGKGDLSSQAPALGDAINISLYGPNADMSSEVRWGRVKAYYDSANAAGMKLYGMFNGSPVSLATFEPTSAASNGAVLRVNKVYLDYVNVGSRLEGQNNAVASLTTDTADNKALLTLASTNASAGHGCSLRFTGSVLPAMRWIPSS